MSRSATGLAEASPGPSPELRRERRAWYVYDWANSAYVTTTGTVLFAPYLTAVATAAACPGLADGEVCGTTLSVLGVPVAPGSLALYTTTVSTALSALLLPLVGALCDRVVRKRLLLGAFALVGASAAAAMAAVTGTDWQLGVLLQVVAGASLGASLVVYNALLLDLAGPDERDAVSSRGWAMGYLGGFLLLAANLGVVSGHDALGLTEAEAVRVSLLSAGLWWGVFSLVPVLGLKDRPLPVPPDGEPRAPRGGAVSGTFGELVRTLRHARAHPMTLLLLAAFLLYNDGVQTVIYAASLFGTVELGLAQAQLITAILLVQGVAFVGALVFGVLAGRFGAQRTVLWSLVAWTGVVAAGFFLPAGRFGLFLGLSVAIGLVLGGTQAISRSLYSQLVPVGREAQYFSLYQAAERGTSWIGTLVFGLVYQLTGSYRPAVASLVVFFVLGGLLLLRVDVRRGIADAGRPQPQRV
ncbi:MFS transporter [uncultured Pseudokineococcus sp.]|uniref:MFS transporter n=1 Tax=uncultured Pseudokineococcus sp. TaxID=1642928 RepID=UPI002639E7E0|nr:MFS transporter [uncultured Pseudokineococcus sp.]